MQRPQHCCFCLDGQRVGKGSRVIADRGGEGVGVSAVPKPKPMHQTKLSVDK